MDSDRHDGDTRNDALAQDNTLARDLAALGRSLALAPSGEALTVAVMARLADTPAPTTANRWQRLAPRLARALASRRRRALVVVTAIMLALLGMPPVRAAVADWFEFAGVSVHLIPAPGPSVAPSPPMVKGSTALTEVRALVAFEPVAPTALGPPQGVQVSADRRLLSMSWTVADVGAVRLDQFDGRLDYTFAKTAPGVQFTTVADSFAMWFERPHHVVVLNADGTSRTETARLAGHTLIWEHGQTALRLEGNLTLARAIEIASSVKALP